MNKGKRITGLEKAVMGIQQQFAKLAPEVIQPLDEMEKSTKEIGERMDGEFGKLANRVRDLEMRKTEQQGINASVIERLNKHNARLRTLEMADDNPLANLSKQQAKSLLDALDAKAKDADAQGLPPLSEDEAPVRSGSGSSRRGDEPMRHVLDGFHEGDFVRLGGVWHKVKFINSCGGQATVKLVETGELP